MFSRCVVGRSLRLTFVLICFSLAVVFSATFAAAQGTAPARVDGLYDCILVNGAVEIPFRFEIATNGGSAQGFFFEGDRKVSSTSGTFADGVLTLEYDWLNSVLEAKFDGDTWTGTIQSIRGRGNPRQIRARRFAPVSASGTPPQVGGDWSMKRSDGGAKTPREELTWQLILRQSGAEVSGAILRIDGDTGNLMGHWDGGTLVLSHFAGERPMLFEATPTAEGTLEITLNRNAKYVAVRSSEARAKGIAEPADPSRYTTVKDPTTPFQFSFADLNGTVMSNTDARFRGKVVILAIGGSWCPNCHDEAPFLMELYRDYKDRGLEIVGLMFEQDEDPAVAGPRMRAFTRRFGLQYPLLLAGTTQNIGEKLPQLVNFAAYPTAIYLGRDGRVRSVHAGFASPATGEEHVNMKRELRQDIERLLAEPAAPSAAASR